MHLEVMRINREIVTRRQSRDSQAPFLSSFRFSNRDFRIFKDPETRRTSRNEAVLTAQRNQHLNSRRTGSVIESPEEQVNLVGEVNQFKEIITTDYLKPYDEIHRNSGCSEDSGLQTNNSNPTPSSSNHNVDHQVEGEKKIEISEISETEMRVTVELAFPPSIPPSANFSSDDEEDDETSKLRIEDDDDFDTLRFI